MSVLQKIEKTGKLELKLQNFMKLLELFFGTKSFSTCIGYVYCLFYFLALLHTRGLHGLNFLDPANMAAISAQPGLM